MLLMLLCPSLPPPLSKDNLQPGPSTLAQTTAPCNLQTEYSRGWHSASRVLPLRCMESNLSTPPQLSPSYIKDLATAASPLLWDGTAASSGMPLIEK
mmetsp:Transcript_8492/g.13961  ORF Transcript_8492/g.13961 Transcript_8492/m.13961 type:complete len:97 (+) Transcript_8492:136-426(+)